MVKEESFETDEKSEGKANPETFCMSLWAVSLGFQNPWLILLLSTLCKVVLALIWSCEGKQEKGLDYIYWYVKERENVLLDACSFESLAKTFGASFASSVKWE